jgi:hypothetical protein
MGLVRSENVVTKAVAKAVEEAIGQFLVLGLGLDDNAKVGVELVCPLAVGAAFEVPNDLSNTSVGQLGIEITL